MVELQRWSDQDVNIIIYHNTSYSPTGESKKLFIRDMNNSRNNCEFNDLEFAVKYVNSLIRIYKED